MFDFLGLLDNRIAMQCLAYIMSFLGDHPCSGCHFPVSGDMEGFVGRFRGILTETLSSARAETILTDPLRRAIALRFSKDGISLDRNLGSGGARITLSPNSMSAALWAGGSKRRSCLWCLGTEKSRGNSRSSMGRARSIAADSAWSQWTKVSIRWQDRRNWSDSARILIT